MSHRYMNTGNGEGIIPQSSRLTTTNASYSDTGIAFSGAASETITLYTFSLPWYIAADLWFKFDLYVDTTSSSASNFRFGYWHEESTYSAQNKSWIEGLHLISGTLKGVLESRTNTTAKGTIVPQAINKILCHIHNAVGTSASSITLTLNDETTSFSTTRNSYACDIGAEVAALKTMVIGFPSDYPCYISNLIISDAEINPKEQVIKLPASATATNMTASANGIYTATAAGQTILQTPDVANLIRDYDTSSVITGIQVVGKNAYRTGTGLASMIGLSKSGNTLTEHGTCNVGSTSATIVDGWGLSSVTLAGLSTMQFGWKAAN